MKFSKSFTSVFFVAVIALFIIPVPGAQGLARLAGWRSQRDKPSLRGRVRHDLL
ncbi:hypothetical protein ABES02_28630 [Neobacillus pocheonensis]|uniref:hypothetical protein n=1 Tax=Neobacillus pocheonensis TaxID=363869 RepID=UPI003D298B9A